MASQDTFPCALEVSELFPQSIHSLLHMGQLDPRLRFRVQGCPGEIQNAGQNIQRHKRRTDILQKLSNTVHFDLKIPFGDYALREH